MMADVILRSFLLTFNLALASLYCVLASFIPMKSLVPLFLNLTPSRGMTLPNHLRDIIYTNDYLLDISEELLMTCDWSYELSVERLHTILQHRFGSFKG